MKVEDIRVGQTVVDNFGNEYVVEIVNYDLMKLFDLEAALEGEPVQLRNGHKAHVLANKGL